MSSKRWILVLALAVPGLAACGGPEAIEQGTAEAFQQQVRELAAVTQEGNFEAALDRAEALKINVQQAQESGTVTPGRAGQIQDNINAFIESIQPEEAPAPVEPPAPVAPSTEPVPAPPAATVPGVTEEDSADLEDTETDAEREAAEEARKEAEKEAEEAEKQAEKEAEEQQKQEEKNGEGKDD